MQIECLSSSSRQNVKQENYVELTSNEGGDAKNKKKLKKIKKKQNPCQQ
jgi:hypothetical protein